MIRAKARGTGAKGIFIHRHNPIYNLRAEENTVDDSFGQGYVRYGFDGSFEVVHQLLVDVRVLAI